MHSSRRHRGIEPGVQRGLIVQIKNANHIPSDLTYKQWDFFLVVDHVILLHALLNNRSAEDVYVNSMMGQMVLMCWPIVAQSCIYSGSSKCEAHIQILRQSLNLLESWRLVGTVICTRQSCARCIYKEGSVHVRPAHLHMEVLNFDEFLVRLLSPF